MGILRNFLKVLPVRLKKAIAEDYQGWGNIYFSQEGEDILLQRVFGDRRSGFFVDVGAHHPKRFSNTYALYSRGWRGINIDATPGSMEVFRRLRPRDQNLECGVGNTEGEMPFYEFEEPALNTFSKARHDQIIETTAYRLKRIVPVKIRKLSSILEENLPPSGSIDFLTIDVEGLDLEILKSNDWNRFSPKVVLVEALDQGVEALQRSEMSRFLSEKGYALFAKTYNTAFFTRDRTDK
jgi:FkbM family methyltransferase